jgi:uncharacterized protein
MMDFDKKDYLISLFLQYEPLLTDTQKLYFKAYVLEDFSLKEIADAYHVSRSAIHDAIHKIEDHLYAYEEKLQLYQKAQNRQQLFKVYNETKDETILDQIKAMDE